MQLEKRLVAYRPREDGTMHYKVNGEIIWAGSLNQHQIENIYRAFLEDGFLMKDVVFVPDFIDNEYTIRITGRREATMSEIEQFKQEERLNRVQRTRESVLNLARLVDQFPQLASKTPVFESTAIDDIADSITP